MSTPIARFLKGTSKKSKSKKGKGVSPSVELRASQKKGGSVPYSIERDIEHKEQVSQDGESSVTAEGALKTEASQDSEGNSKKEASSSDIFIDVFRQLDDLSAESSGVEINKLFNKWREIVNDIESGNKHFSKNMLLNFWEDAYFAWDNSGFEGKEIIMQEGIQYKFPNSEKDTYDINDFMLLFYDRVSAEHEKSKNAEAAALEEVVNAVQVEQPEIAEAQTAQVYGEIVEEVSAATALHANHYLSSGAPYRQAPPPPSVGKNVKELLQQNNIQSDEGFYDEMDEEEIEEGLEEEIEELDDEVIEVDKGEKIEEVEIKEVEGVEELGDEGFYDEMDEEEIEETLEEEIEALDDETIEVDKEEEIEEREIKEIDEMKDIPVSVEENIQNTLATIYEEDDEDSAVDDEDSAVDDEDSAVDDKEGDNISIDEVDDIGMDSGQNFVEGNEDQVSQVESLHKDEDAGTEVDEESGSIALDLKKSLEIRRHLKQGLDDLYEYCINLAFEFDEEGDLNNYFNQWADIINEDGDRIAEEDLDSLKQGINNIYSGSTSEEYRDSNIANIIDCIDSCKSSIGKLPSLNMEEEVVEEIEEDLSNDESRIEEFEETMTYQSQEGKEEVENEMRGSGEVSVEDSPIALGLREELKGLYHSSVLGKELDNLYSYCQDLAFEFDYSEELNNYFNEWAIIIEEQGEYISEENLDSLKEGINDMHIADKIQSSSEHNIDNIISCIENCKDSIAALDNASREEEVEQSVTHEGKSSGSEVQATQSEGVSVEEAGATNPLHENHYKSRGGSPYRQAPAISAVDKKEKGSSEAEFINERVGSEHDQPDHEEEVVNAEQVEQSEIAEAQIAQVEGASVEEASSTKSLHENHYTLRGGSPYRQAPDPPSIGKNAKELLQQNNTPNSEILEEQDNAVGVERMSGGNSDNNTKEEDSSKKEVINEEGRSDSSKAEETNDQGFRPRAISASRKSTLESLKRGGLNVDLAPGAMNNANRKIGSTMQKIMNNSEPQDALQEALNSAEMQDALKEMQGFGIEEVGSSEKANIKPGSSPNVAQAAACTQSAGAAMG